MQALRQYRRHAAGYDASAKRTMWIRQQAIAKLGLLPGQRVLDVACGTGLSFEILRRAVGHDGEVVGVDISPEMTGLARQRIARQQWQNVQVIESRLERADLPDGIDAVLFHFTHDVLRSTVALERIFSAVRPGARVAFAGMKLAPWWMAPVNLIVRIKASPYMTTFDGLGSPWDLALPYLVEFDWYPVMVGTGYIGWGITGNDD
jgi:demethylmenaquinone methyltransferase/2-methoxy-6-polyprenyl-1,4-benzoquinol methylase